MILKWNSYVGELLLISLLHDHCLAGGNTPCQSKINPHKMMCYWLSSTVEAHGALERTCGSHGGHLVTVDSRPTADYVEGFVAEFDEVFWIGYDERNPTWNDLQTVFSWSNYFHPEPDGNTEYCTAMVRDVENKRWADRYCHYNYRGICQLDYPSANLKTEFIREESVLHGGQVSEEAVRSLIECAFKCQMLGKCYIVEFETLPKTCKFYKKGSRNVVLGSPNKWFRINPVYT